MSKSRKDKRVYFVIFGVFIAVFLFTFLAQRFKGDENTEAASLANFDPGYIISDYQMSNYNSMSESDIQRFLTSKNPCGNTNYNYYLQLSANKNYTWHWANGHFVCLSEERFGDGEVIGSGDTAAHIIWQAAQDYRINPQVLIVLLQKETGLITDQIPNNGDYRKATGYGCPDTAACSSKYYGFKNQIRNAAALFRTVLDGGWTNYPLGNNYIQYNPNAACGGSVVNVRSLATSALYRYTPYQPNAGALAAGYGTASCGAYGNRNFYLYFEDWFGGITNDGVVIPKSSNIVEGEYTIKSALKDDMLIDVDGGVDANGTNIQIYSKNGAGAQKWKIENNGDGSYSFINPATNKVLDVDDAGKTSGTNVQLYRKNNTCAQKWHIVKNNDDTYSIFSTCSGLALDVAGGETANSTNIQIYRPNGTDAQKWKMVPEQTISDGEYNIKSKLSQKIGIDISGGAEVAKDGTNIQIYNINNTPAQTWRIKYNKDGYYSIINPISNKSLDVTGAGKTSGANVQLYGRSNICAQKWQIVKNNDGSYSIFSACYGLALDVAGGNTTKRTNIQVYRSNKTDAQKWNFNPMKTVSDGEYKIVSNLSDIILVSVAADNANIQIFEAKRDNKKWKFEYDGDGNYIITDLDTNKVIDVINAGVTSGTKTQLYKFNNTCAQKWQIVKNNDGTYSLFSTCSGLALDVSGGSTVSGTSIQIYRPNNTDAQKWKLKQ